MGNSVCYTAKPFVKKNRIREGFDHLYTITHTSIAYNADYTHTIH